MSIGVTASVVGLRKIAEKVAEQTTRHERAMEAAIYQKAVEIMAKAIPLTPARTSILRSTHYIAPPVRGLSGPVSELGFGTKYAEPVHEASPSLTWTSPGTGPKFLERPVNEAKKGYVRDMKDKVKRNVREGKEFKRAGYPTAPRQVSDAEIKAANRVAGLSDNG